MLVPATVVANFPNLISAIVFLDEITPRECIYM